jgi:hypothetical protein
MKRLALLILTSAFGFVDFGAAMDQKQKEQPGTLQATQSGAAASTTQTPTEHTSTPRQGCAGKGSKLAGRQHDRSVQRRSSKYRKTRWNTAEVGNHRLVPSIGSSGVECPASTSNRSRVRSRLCVKTRLPCSCSF